LTWDTSVLQYLHVQNITPNLPNLLPPPSPQNFFVLDNVLGFAWLTLQPSGISLSDGEILFETCFQVIGDTMDCAPVEFTGTVEWISGANDFVICNCLTGEVCVLATGNSEALAGNFAATISPNPFSDEVVFAFRLNQKMPVRLEIVDVFGRQAAVVSEQEFGAGEHRISWEGSGLAAGCYFARITAGSETVVFRLLKN
ncbi:MAG: T9SS type A sorting domain-containing protein, partial [Bacteroidota bacterium]